eukprot:symbB.v1.2.009120.t1/scaffold572.1/size185581/9
MRRKCAGSANRNSAVHQNKEEMDQIPRGTKSIFLRSSLGVGASAVTPDFLERWRAISGLQKVPATHFKKCSVNIAIHVRRGDITPEHRWARLRWIADEVQHVVTFHGSWSVTSRGRQNSSFAAVDCRANLLAVLSTLEQSKEWQIDHVVILTSPSGKTWQCKTKQQDEVTYFQLSKWDRAATMALSNRGLELRSQKEPRMLNQSNSESIIAARNAKCDQLVQAYLKDAAEKKGGVWNPTKPTEARAEHALLVASFIELQLPCLMGVGGPVEGLQAAPEVSKRLKIFITRATPATILRSKIIKRCQGQGCLKIRDVMGHGIYNSFMAKMQCRDDAIFERLSRRAQEIVKDLDAQGLAIVAWSFATIGRKDETLLSLIAQEARQKLDTFGVQNISNLIWANATLGLRADALHADLLRECLTRMEDFTTQELAIVNWAFTKLAYPVGDEWKAALRSRILRLKEYAPSELSMIAWALATRGDYDPDLLAYVARRSMELMRSFTGQNLATIIWAIATISYKDDPSIDEFLRMALGAIIARSNEFQPLNIALISWGLAKLSFKAEAAFESMCDAAVQQIDSFVPQNLVQLMWACGTAGYRNEQFLRAAARVAKRTIDQFSSQHQSNFLWACARLNFKEDVELLRVVAAAAQRKMHEGSPQHLSNIAWAASQLGPQHFQECLFAVVSETSRRIDEFDPPSIMMLSDSLYEANFNNGGQIMQVLRGQVQRMGNELFELFTTGLPRPRGRGSQQELGEYQRRLRQVGLTTFGYEHTNSLFEQLQLRDGTPWQIQEAMAMPGWTTNARRTTVARRYALRVGTRQIEDAGTIFTSAFASAAEDATADFIVVWLGQGKADSPSVGRAGRSGDAECRAMMATHEMLKKENDGEVSGTLAFHTSGVPCLSCVGVAAQFKRHYPRVRFCFTFMNRPLSEREDSSAGGVDASAGVLAPNVAPKTPRR